jgi:hypothetical protein
MKTEISNEVKMMAAAVQEHPEISLDVLPLPFMTESLHFPEGAGRAALQLLLEKAERGEELNPLEALGASLLHKMGAFNDWRPSAPEPIQITSLHKGNLSGTYTTDLPIEVFTKGLTLDVAPDGVKDAFFQNNGAFGFSFTRFRLLSATPMNPEESVSLQQYRFVFEVEFEIVRESGSDLAAILEGIAARVVHRTQPLPRTFRKLENVTSL